MNNTIKNQLTISGTGNIFIGDIYGVISAESNCHNCITISGTKNRIIGNIYGSNELPDCPLSSNNTFIITGTPILEGAKLYGANYDKTGNKLFIDGWSGNINGLHYFESYNFKNIPATFVNNNAVVTIQDYVDAFGHKQTAGFSKISPKTAWSVCFAADTVLKSGDIITLIDYSNIEDIADITNFTNDILVSINQTDIRICGKIICDTSAKTITLKII